jgi:hypothetical protein
MEIPDLNPDERLALVGLMKVVVMSDGNVSEDELEHVELLADAFGAEEYQRTLDGFEKRFKDETQFRQFLTGITRQEARELMFATVLESAGEGALDGAEVEMLDWLSRTWNVRIEIADGAGP